MAASSSTASTCGGRVVAVVMVCASASIVYSSNHGAGKLTAAAADGGCMSPSAAHHRGRFLAIATCVQIAVLSAALVITMVVLDADDILGRYGLSAVRQRPMLRSVAPPLSA